MSSGNTQYFISPEIKRTSINQYNSLLSPVDIYNNSDSSKNLLHSNILNLSNNFCSTDLITKTSSHSVNHDTLLKEFKIKSKKNFTLIHLNINSIFNKTDELDSILNLGYDMILLNETKLDQTVPQCFYVNSIYNMIRLDRNRNGGGVAIFIKKDYKFKSNVISDQIECLHLELKINNINCNFLAIYKPPSMNVKHFVDELDNILFQINTSLPLFVIGDLNIDLKSAKGQDFIRYMQNYDLHNHVKEYTRMASRYIKEKDTYSLSKSLIDVIFHNNSFINNTLVVPCPFSDHCFVLADLSLPSVLETKSKKQIRNLNEKNLEIISNKISTSRFNFMCKNQSINETWLDLKNLLLQITNESAPIKTINNNQKSRFPWVDKELLIHKKNRDVSYCAYKSNYDPINYAIYKRQRAKYQTLKRNKMIDYFKTKSKINDFKNSKMYWRFYSSSINMKSSLSKKDEQITLLVNDQTIDEPHSIANTFNHFFTSLNATSDNSYSKSAQEIKENFKYLKEKKLLITGVFDFKPTNMVIVENILQKMDNESSPGNSGIPIKVLKSSSILTQQITNLFNHCILEKCIPNEWKSSVVTPLYKKKGNEDDLNNYRGISVISPLAKIFEKILASQIIEYINEYNILTADQHGFRSNHSCETALHELISDLNTARDNTLASLLLFIDFRKAFDLIDSKLLIHKLSLMGFTKNAQQLIENYFNEREQVVKYNNIYSDSASIKLGVPQGSVLGPLFFTLFINDLPLLIENLNKKLFADDTTFYKSMPDVKDLIDYFVDNIQPLINWCKTNKLDLNWSKTFFFFIKNKRFNYPREFLINNNVIQVVDNFKLLGVTLDSKLSFDEFITCTKKTINKKLNSIKKLFYLSHNVKIQFFKSFIIPHFDYCLTLCIYFPKATLQRLCNLFYLCLFNLFNLKFSNNCNIIHNQLEAMSLFSFQHHLLLKLSIFLYKIINNTDVINLNKFIEIQKNTHYNLRSNLVNGKQLCTNNHYGKATCKYFFPKLKTIIGPEEFDLKFSFFKNRINNNIIILNDTFIKEFPKFDLYIKNFDYLKKK